MSAVNPVHYCDDGRTPCGRQDFAAIASELRADVTCRRCLASLAKRDKAFQAKARGQFAPFFRNMSSYRFKYGWTAEHAQRAARAIAREEGRLQ